MIISGLSSSRHLASVFESYTLMSRHIKPLLRSEIL